MYRVQGTGYRVKGIGFRVNCPLVTIVPCVGKAVRV